MNRALKWSLGLNLLALAGLGLALSSLSPARNSYEESPSIPPRHVAAANGAPAREAFQWDQLGDARDYPAYVANLRVAGCPEATVRDIVSGDVARAFARQRRRLGLDGAGGGAWSRARETQLVTTLVGTPANVDDPRAISNREGPITTAPADPATAVASDLHRAASRSVVTPAANAAAGIPPATTPEPSAANNSAHGPAPHYPVVYQDAIAAAPQLTAAEQAVIARVQQQFVADIGGLNQNPQDPAYRARWQTAQQQADDALRASLGAQFYLNARLQQYFRNFQQQILAAGNGPLSIDPDRLAQ
jgi:hypothetical protein